MSSNHISLGKRGEQLARSYLLKKDYEIVGENIRLGRFEVDIIAKEKKTIVFVEVKTRRSDEFGAPEEAVTNTKLRHLSSAAMLYLHEHPKSKHIRIDVISIIIPYDKSKHPRLRHFRGVGEDAPLVNLA